MSENESAVGTVRHAQSEAASREGMLAAIAQDELLAALVLRCADGEPEVLRVAPSAALFADPEPRLIGASLSVALGDVGEDVSDIVDCVARVRASGVPESLRFQGTLNGAARVATVAVAPIRLEDATQGLALVFADRTREHEAAVERERIQERAEVVGQLEVVGRLAAGVAHDFNNVLTAIIGNTALLRMTLERAGGLTVRAEHIVEEIERASDRASALVRQLLTFTDQRPTEPTEYRVGELLESTSRIIERLLPDSVEVSVEVYDEVAVRIDRGLFEQSVVNLAVNASDAMEQGGRLSLSARREGDNVIVEVSDTGAGMAPEIAKRIFEPFFTTKPPGKGTGLGLVNVRRTIEQAGGEVVAESTEGVGTTMRLTLPRAELPEIRDERGSAPRGVVGGRERVFLCEDDHIVRQSVVGMLEQAGYRVMSANGPEEALRVLGTTEESYDLVISDMIMPTMNGVEFAKRVRADLPEVPILFISGYSSDVLVDQGVQAADIDLLQKPFDYATLVTRVKKAIGRTATSL